MLSNRLASARRVGALSQARADLFQELFAVSGRLSMNFITLGGMCVRITTLEQLNGCIENQKNHHMGYFIPNSVTKEDFLKRKSDEKIRILKFVVECEDVRVLDEMKTIFESTRKMLKIISELIPRSHGHGRAPDPTPEGRDTEIGLMLVAVWFAVDNFRRLYEN